MTGHREGRVQSSVHNSVRFLFLRYFIETVTSPSLPMRLVNLVKFIVYFSVCNIHLHKVMVQPR